jgi:AcrR family transcriptional regulator
MNKAQRRQELLKAARNVFVERGYHDAKVEDIAAAAKVGKGTIYLYFPDKRSIFIQLVDNLFERMNAAVMPVDTGKAVDKQVRGNIRAILDVVLEDPALAQILFSYAAGLDPAFVGKMRLFYEALHQLLQGSLEVGQALGIVEKGNTRAYATFTIGGFKELVLDAAVSGRVTQQDRDTLEQAVLDMLQSGYLRLPSRGGAKKKST